MLRSGSVILRILGCSRGNLRLTESAPSSPDYLARRGVPAHPNELIHHDCVNFRFQSSGQMFRWPFSLGDRSVEVVPDAAIVTDVSDAVATVIASGGGVGITPTYVAAPFVRRNELVPVLQKFAVPRSNITALWPEGRRSNPNLKAFIAFLSEVFPRQPPWDETVARASRSPGVSSQPLQSRSQCLTAY
jgi:DNA-binding transcriptional LysR family regulator